MKDDLTHYMEAVSRLRAALQVYADKESWEDVTRVSEDWPRFEWCGDDGKEFPWELAQEALARPDDN